MRNDFFGEMAETGGVPLNASPVRRWAGVFGCRPFAFPAFSQAESVASRAPAHADVERVGGVGEVPCLLHVGFGLFSACLRSFSASRSSSRVLNLSVSAFFVLMGFGVPAGPVAAFHEPAGVPVAFRPVQGLKGPVARLRAVDGV